LDMANYKEFLARINWKEFFSILAPGNANQERFEATDNICTVSILRSRSEISTLNKLIKVLGRYMGRPLAIFCFL